MSAPLSPAQILFRQRLLSAEGLYAGKLDGVWGPKTEAADAKWNAMSKLLMNSYPLDSRSAPFINSLCLRAQEAFLHLTLRCVLDSHGDEPLLVPNCDHSLVMKFISGTRTYAEQDELYAIGRTPPLAVGVVTYAKGGQSNHNFCLAVDIGLWRDGHYLGDGFDKDYEAVGEWIMSVTAGLEWGGNWPKRKRDLPHFQLATGLTIQEVRRRFEMGEAYFGG